MESRSLLILSVLLLVSYEFLGSQNGQVMGFASFSDSPVLVSSSYESAEMHKTYLFPEGGSFSVNSIAAHGEVFNLFLHLLFSFRESCLLIGGHCLLLFHCVEDLPKPHRRQRRANIYPQSNRQRISPV
jgi:hypothetical protein